MTPFADLNPPYSVICADPPWSFLTRSSKGKGRSAEKHYACMTIDDIKALPVRDLAAKDAVLFLWVTDPMLLIGIDVMQAWGFTYKTVGFTWAKTNRTKSGYFTGMGYWSRANSEMCLLGTIGRPRRISKSVPRLIVSPRREHSRKPDEAFDRMRSLVGGPAVELFSRERRPGFDNWGNEREKWNEHRMDLPEVQFVERA